MTPPPQLVSLVGHSGWRQMIRLHLCSPNHSTQLVQKHYCDFATALVLLITIEQGWGGEG